VLVEQHDAALALAEEIAVEELADEAERPEALRRRVSRFGRTSENVRSKSQRRRDGR